MEIILGDANALTIIILMEGVCVEKHIMGVIIVTWTVLNVEMMTMGFLEEATNEKQATL